MKETVQVTRGAEDALDAYIADGFAMTDDEKIGFKAGYRNAARLSATSAPAGVDLDWRRIAKLAGEYGVRYRTNTSLVRFLDAVTEPALAAAPAPSGQEVAGESLAQRQAREVMNPKSSGLAVTQHGQSYNATTPPASGVTVPEGEVKGILLPPGTVDDPVYLEGWLDGQTYLLMSQPAALSTPSATPGEEARVSADDLGPPQQVVAGIIEDCLARHGVDLAECEGTLDDADQIIAHLATATPGALDPATVEREALEWLAECDNLIVAASKTSDEWEVRRANGQLRGTGPTPIAAIIAARETALATDPHQHGGKA